MIEKGFLLTISVNWPPLSNPTYPGGDPIILLTECFSIYSLISSLTIISSFPYITSAKALANSVLPTPVGPKKRKEPIGRFGFFRPALALLIASLSM